MRAMASQINSISIVYSTNCSGVDQRKHQRSVWLTFVVEIQFPAQRASNAQNVSVWWRHHERHDASFSQACICLFNDFNELNNKTTSKLRMTGLFDGKPPVTGWYWVHNFHYKRSAWVVFWRWSFITTKYKNRISRLIILLSFRIQKSLPSFRI